MAHLWWQLKMVRGRYRALDTQVVLVVNVASK